MFTTPVITLACTEKRILHYLGDGKHQNIPKVPRGCSLCLQPAMWLFSWCDSQPVSTAGAAEGRMHGLHSACTDSLQAGMHCICSGYERGTLPGLARGKLDESPVCCTVCSILGLLWGVSIIVCSRWVILHFLKALLCSAAGTRWQNMDRLGCMCTLPFSAVRAKWVSDFCA